jgi:molybdopterin molybdotransferase
MISVDEAYERILSVFRPLEAETVSLWNARGRVLAEDVYADVDTPPFENSAMDGYAVRPEDVQGASRGTPIRLRVIGTLAAGQPPGQAVEPGTAIRIMTGAPMPPGADAVVRFEETSEGDKNSRMTPAHPADEVRVYMAVEARDNVRAAGEDIHAGELVLAAGTELRPAEIGVLASVGRKDCLVHRRPRVAVLATGDELVEPDEPLMPGKIRNSNAYTNAALVEKYGGIPLPLGIARDNVADLTAKLQRAVDLHADLILTSAGVSVGEYDVVKDVLTMLGEVNFWQVRMKPGKPLAFGHIKGIPLIGFPGNPVSSMVSFERFARPAILKMQGKRRLRKQVVRAILREDVGGGDRREFKRAIVDCVEGVYYARLTGEQGSGILTSMVKANGLAIIPEGTRRVSAGQEVSVEMLDWPEGE